jgi:hypothetical protein
MRSMNCQNIRSEIEAAGSVDYLSRAAVAHINSCAACETLSRQQSRLHSILSNLGTVAAPGDFDFKLRARLAAEKAAKRSSFPVLNLSFGSRAAAAAMVLLLIGSALVYVSLRTPTTNSVATNQPAAAPQSGAAVQAVDKPTVAAVNNDASTKSDGNSNADRNSAQRVTNRDFKSELVAQSGTRPKSKDLSSRPAKVLRYDQLGEAGSSVPFQINASYQDLKVSGDDGSGVSRTISLPSVSFGSQSGLAQNASPLVATAKGTW